MAIGRPSIDPSWDDSGASPPPDPSAGPPAAAPASPTTPPTPPESQAIEAARSNLAEQPTHEQLEPLEPIAPTAPVPPPPLTKEDAATILDSSPNPPSAAASAPAPEAAPAAPTPQPEPVYDPTVPTAETLARSLDRPLAATVVPSDHSDLSDPSGTHQATRQPGNQVTPSPTHIPQQERVASLPAVRPRLPTAVTILLGFVVLIVGAIGLYLGSEAGYLSLGIERLWGISNRPQQALGTAAAAIGSAASYTVEGDVSLTIGGSGEPTDRTVATQFRQQVVSPLSELDSSWTVGPNVPHTVLGSRLAAGGTVRIVAQSDEKTLFVRLNEGDQTLPWVKTDLAELAAFKLQPLQWQALLQQLAAAPNGKRLGGKTINGVKAKGYQLQVPIGTVLESVSPPLTSLGDVVTVDVWLESRRGLPQLLTVSGSIQTNGTVSGQLVFGSASGVAPLALPSADQVSAGSLGDWLEVNGIVGVQSAASRDATRRSDLDTIAQALQAYAAAQTPFGYPITSGIVHLDTDPFVASALAPYLATMPHDPQQPDRYYGYQSDGTTYRLTAVAEEGTGDDLTEIGGLKLITRTNQ